MIYFALSTRFYNSSQQMSADSYIPIDLNEESPDIGWALKSSKEGKIQKDL